MGGRDFVSEAVKSVKELLVDLLEKGDYCGARRVGEALEKIINLKSRPGEIPTPEAMQGSCEQERR